MGLAALLHDRTKPLHTEAERSGVMAALIRGHATRDEYLRLLAALHTIYATLEEQLAGHAGHAVLAPMAAPAFARREALDADLVAGAGTAWRTSVRVAPEAEAYAAHLRTLSAERPALLLAHAWLRYLGDLNGGQILARVLRAAPALEGMPTHFYEFPTLSDPRAAAAEWRGRLDALPLDPETMESLAAEACDGFRRHIALFRAIADQVPLTPSPSAA